MQALYKSGNVAVQATVQVQNRPCTPAKSTPQRVAVSPTRESTDGALIRHFAAAAAAVQLLSCAPSYAMWDGESSAQGSCPLGDAGIECRKRLLAKDGLGSYTAAADNAAKIPGSAATGVPVAELGSAYAKETAILSDAILQYATMDVYDPARVDLIKSLKKEGQEWVSKYARGGSARTVSARKFYIAIDAVQGHLASNGFAPLPKNKMDKLVKDVEDTRALLVQGK